MKFIQSTLCFTVVAFLSGLPVQAAEEKVPVKKRPAVVREARRQANPEPRPGDEAYTEQIGQTVFQVLLAEVALQRGDSTLASKAYADLALRTRDPKVLERTVEVAGYARRLDLALETARLWVEVEPSSRKAQQLLASVLIMTDQLDELAPALIRMLEADKDSLGENLLGLNRMLARNPDRQAVFRLIDTVTRPYSGIAEAHYAVAMAAASAGETVRALAEARRAQELRPDWELAVLLQAQMLMRENPTEAIRLMQDFIGRYPKAREIHLHLARLLVAEKRYVEARQHFDLLLKDYPDNPDVVYPVAILALQQNDLALAEAQFRHFLTLEVPDKSYAYFFLGQIAEESERNTEALAYYAQVRAGERYIVAQMRSARLLAVQGRLDEARRLLADAKVSSEEERIRLAIAEAGLIREAGQTQAAFDLLDALLTRQPDQTDLLYETALLAEKLERMDLLESRLRKLIELRPESAQAYNALGYSFADRNLNLPEALMLIEKALKLSPDDYFILDSMGWVLYRLGDLPGALAYLERAHVNRDDPEISAHLGELLWVIGRKDDARRILLEAQKKHPDSEVLSNAIKKFAP